MTVDNPTLTRPVINPDLVDNFVNDPLPRHEAAAVLAFYLPLVDAWSQPQSWKNHYLQARLHVGAAIGRSLGREKFLEGAELGAEINARRSGDDPGDTYFDWTMEQLFEDLSTVIDQLLDGAA